MSSRPSPGDVTIGSVYATLDRLEAKGLVSSSRIPGTDASSRRVFAITGAGARALTQTRATRDRLWLGVKLHRLPNF
ncbi:MAG: helix-turn-helix transcriptional regulator [Acidobacteria bacterium]|nr:helix-turn-helix transcriptional regulator [Acidobacteriota bacterium]